MFVQPRVLFILKRREDYNLDPETYSTGMSTGLLNSASFVVDMLNETGNIIADCVVVTDNNDIDRAVTQFQPTHVIIEALWVVPSKFDVLCKLHPNVRWIIRFHSEMPFIANEGIAIEWIGGYLDYPNVQLAANAPRFYEELKTIARAHTSRRPSYWSHELTKVVYLPNYYPIDLPPYKQPETMYEKDVIDIGCFGAIRPLKNHLTQAVAAISFGDSIRKPINFHINAGRTEMKGDSVLKNLISLFDVVEAHGHSLVIHDWMPHDEFVDLSGTMDLGLQVSFSETFNIVAADMISQGVPIVVSKEIPWAISGIADPTDSVSITRSLQNAYRFPIMNIKINMFGLRRYVVQSAARWEEFLLK